MSPDSPATAAKLPIMRNSGRTASWSLVTYSTTTVPNTARAGLRPTIRAVPTTPTRPIAAAIGTSRKTSAHMIKKRTTAAPTGALWAIADRGAIDAPMPKAAKAAAMRQTAARSKSLARGDSRDDGDRVPADAFVGRVEFSTSMPANASRSVTRNTMNCAITASARNPTTPHRNGAWGRRRIMVEALRRNNSSAAPSRLHTKMRYRTSIKSAPATCNHRTALLPSRAANRSIARLTRPAAPAGNVAAMATAITIARISLKPSTKPVPNQRRPISTAVRMATTRIASTPINAIRRNRDRHLPCRKSNRPMGDRPDPTCLRLKV